MIIAWIIFALILIGLIIAGTAYTRLVKIIDKYSNTTVKLGFKAIDFINVCNNSFDLNLKCAVSNKKLENAYAPKQKVVIVDKDLIDSKSIVAVSIVAHEIGHAIQDQNENFLFRLDLFMKRVFRVLKFIAIPLAICGFVFLFIDGFRIYGEICLLVTVGVWIFSLITRIVTIPMEYQASNIAYGILRDNRLLTRNELKITKKILNAAALTYVGAIFINLLNFFRAIKNSFKT